MLDNPEAIAVTNLLRLVEQFVCDRNGLSPVTRASPIHEDSYAPNYSDGFKDYTWDAQDAWDA